MIGPAPAPVTGATCVPYVAYTPYKAYHPSMAPSVSSLLFPPQRTHKQPRATVVRSDASSGSGTLGSGSGSGSGSEGSSSSGLEERLARCAVAERDAAETPARGFGGVKAGGSSAVSLVSGASFSSDVGASIAGTDTPTSTTSMYIPTPTTASSMSRPLPPLPSLPLSRWERTKGATKRLAEKLGDTDVMFPPPTD
ncbi:uncharacterized protein K452DRAFT_287953 [Aplosporella prunicola CBS 121167]|uniref:Uncharacterized protein n=1 Tax=Aplosporella prunicola CBS 121167 TaxID=1176127 RepID=A0A6A6BE98_9PEZI|nr:uncharacterized protein K452DRAFT_287953 [Aplosporella prunicola CBS 121167]KAF2141247.1 hypothetical protein K452DRAFT_287953 [Aplosporella prunicola CBS 121167]